MKFEDEENGGNNVIMIIGDDYKYNGRNVQHKLGWGIIEILDMRDDNQKWMQYKQGGDCVLNKDFFGMKSSEMNMRALWWLS